MKRLTLALTLAALFAPVVPLAAEPASAGVAVRAAHRRSFRHWRRPFYWGWGYGPYWYDPFWYDPWYRPGYGGYYYGRYAVARDWAVVDTDVSPESARVYLDGQLIGTADDFDGYPDYLYLRRGNYRLEFRLDGYQARTIGVEARPGVKLDVGEKLAKIPGAPRYGSYDEAVPSGAVRRFWAKRRDVAESITDDDQISGYDRRRPRERPRDWDDSDRYSEERRDDSDDRRDVEVERDRDRAEGGWRDRAEARPGDGRLRFTVSPADAAIYLNDRFIGTADELDDAAGFAVAPGRHTLVFARPGYRDKRVEVEISRRETERVEIRLER
jgi:PEGA domain